MHSALAEAIALRAERAGTPLKEASLLRCCRFLPALRHFPDLWSVTLHATDYCGTALDTRFLTPPPELHQLTLSGLSLSLEGGSPTCATLTQLSVSTAADVSIAASLPRLQQLELSRQELGRNRRVRLAGPGLQLPALTRLDLISEEAEVDVGAMPALRQLKLHPSSAGAFTARGLYSLPALMQLRLTLQATALPDAIAVLASAAPSLHCLELQLRPAVLGGELAAAVGSLRQLTRLACSSHAVLPLLTAQGQLQELCLQCAPCHLQPEDISRLSCLRGLQKLMYSQHAGWLEQMREEEDVLLEVRLIGMRMGLFLTADGYITDVPDVPLWAPRTGVGEGGVGRTRGWQEASL